MLNRLSSTDTLEAPAAEQSFDLREIISFAWRHWKFIASVVGVALLIGAVSILRETPRYTASALILLEPQRETTAANQVVPTDVDTSFAMVESQMAIIRSTVFLRRVVERVGLVSDPEFGSRPAPTQSPQEPSILDTIRAYFFGTPAETKPEPSTPENPLIPADIVASTEALKGATSVTRTGQGFVLTISATSVDPARAARLANAVANAYIVEKLDARFEAAKRASGWLSDRLGELRKQLRESEEAVAQFRADNGLFQSGGNIALNQQQLSELNARLQTARADVAEKKARVELLEKGGNPQSLPDVPNSGLAALRQQEATISQRQADLLARYNDRHPLVVNVQAEHRDVQRAIAAETQRIVANIKNEYQLAKTRAEIMERSFQEQTGQTGVDNQTAITLRDLERTVTVNRSLFEDFLQKAKISQEQATFEAKEARVITPALPPGGPSSPRKGQVMTIALVLGLLLGVGGAWAKEQLNAGFTTGRQIESMLQVPLLTSVSSLEQTDLNVEGKTIAIPFCPSSIPLSRFSEAIRALRSGIQMTDVDSPPQVIQVTSTVPDEGKTTIGLSLAVSAAVSGLNVLFVDADLRHASGSHFFGLHSKKGLVDVLLGSAELEQVLKSLGASLWLLPAGSQTQNPADLLGSERMKSLIARCRQSFDYIVIDTPPVGPVIDPIIVSQLADKVAYIVRWAATPRELVQQSIKRISGHKKLAGVVFNHVNDGLAQKYGKDAYSFYYGSRDYNTYYSS